MIATPNRRALLLASVALAAPLFLAPGAARAAPAFGLGATWSGLDSGGGPARFDFVVATQTGTDPLGHPWAFSADGLVWAIPSPGGGTQDFNPVGADFVAGSLVLTVVGAPLSVSPTGTFFQTDRGDWDVSVAGDTITFTAPPGLELVGDPFLPSAFAVQVALAPPAAVPTPPAVAALGLGLLGLAVFAGRARRR